MKKLISLLTAVSVVSACSLAAFATDYTVDYGNSNTSNMPVTDATTPTDYTEANGVYTFNLANVNGVENTQAQTTILAVKGTTISVGSIQYINQSSGKSFSFALKDPLTEDVNVLVGGSSIQPTKVSTIEAPVVSTGYTVSGTVANFVTQDFIDNELTPYVEEVFAGDQTAIDDYVATCVLGYSTKVRLYSKNDWTNSIASDYLSAYESGTSAPVAFKETVVDSVSGTYTLSEIPNGDYVLVLDRDGALPYFKYVTVSDSNVAINEITLALGDIAADYAVDFTDVSTVIEDMADLGADNYKAGNDTNVDLAVDFTDVSTVIANMTDIWSYGEDAIDDTVN